MVSATRSAASLVLGVNDEHADGAEANSVASNNLLDGAEAKLADQRSSPGGNDDRRMAIEQLE